MTAAAAKPPKAPTSHEASELPCTHIACDACDFVDPWEPSRPAGEWSCPWCGDDAPVYEHWSETPLGFRDDKACHWPALVVDRRLITPEVWVYKAAVPGA